MLTAPASPSSLGGWNRTASSEPDLGNLAKLCPKINLKRTKDVPQCEGLGVQSLVLKKKKKPQNKTKTLNKLRIEHMVYSVVGYFPNIYKVLILIPGMAGRRRKKKRKRRRIEHRVLAHWKRWSLVTPKNTGDLSPVGSLKLTEVV